MNCEECGKEFPNAFSLINHENTHQVRTVRKDPLVLILELPDGCVPGRWDSAEAFAGNIAELYLRFPGRRFQFVQFAVKKGESGVQCTLSILAIADPV